jgi:acetyltransferase-like isoleucine patch superfamily enzyme
VEIQEGAKVGCRVKISSHTFICRGVTIQDEVFVGHGVMFINDRYPRATAASGELQTDADWACTPTLVKRGASIGTNATILCGVVIGEDAIVGAGSVVTREVPDKAIVAGNPARVLRLVDRVPVLQTAGRVQIPAASLGGGQQPARRGVLAALLTGEGEVA